MEVTQRLQRPLAPDARWSAERQRRGKAMPAPVPCLGLALAPSTHSPLGGLLGHIFAVSFHPEGIQLALCLRGDVNWSTGTTGRTSSKAYSDRSETFVQSHPDTRGTKRLQLLLTLPCQQHVSGKEHPKGTEWISPKNCEQGSSC